MWGREGAAIEAGIRPAWVDDDLFPFESHFVEVDGNVVHYIDEGTGPTLLMLHGNPTWSFVYRQVVSALSDRFRCVAIDYPGFGLSVAAPGYGLGPQDHARVVAAMIGRLGLDRYTLVVQDWGGPIGLWAAMQDPARLESLVVGNTWAWPVNGDLHFEAFSKMMGGPGGRLAIRRLNLFVEMMVPLGHRRRTLPGAEMDHYRAALPNPARRQASGLFPHAITSARDFLAGIDRGSGVFADRPALVVWGDRDVAFRDVERRRWERLLVHSTTVVLGGAGHYVQSDAPGDFAAAVADWYPTRRTA